jgi:hypothetical protein
VARDNVAAPGEVLRHLSEIFLELHPTGLHLPVRIAGLLHVSALLKIDDHKLMNVQLFVNPGDRKRELLGGWSAVLSRAR